IRSKIGRYLDHHPHSFKVTVDHGNVLLTGDITDALYQRIQPVIREMPGVCSVKRATQQILTPQKKESA
ncbi:BON domain-containing protein, partial [bacterium]|nr:BON domain-containing protein [bacterium]